MGLWGPLCLVAAILPHGLTAGAAVVVVDGGGGDGGDGVGHRGGTHPGENTIHLPRIKKNKIK